MPEAVEKSEERDVDELLEGLKESIEQAKEGETKHWKEVKENSQQK